MNIKRFPIYRAGYVFNKFSGVLGSNYSLKHSKITIQYPCRLNAMAIDPSAVCYNKSMIFNPGEVVISLNKKIKVTVNVVKGETKKLIISSSTNRKVLVKHAYLIMCKALNISPSLQVDVNHNEVPKHCGFGSSSSTIAAVSCAINELYGCPISNSDLVKYLSSNHGEEVSDDNDNDLKLVQSIGGGAVNGLTSEGLTIIAGRATIIATIKYSSDVLVGIPKDFIPKSAGELMKLEEENLWKFEKTGKKYAKEIAYHLIHKVLPDMANGKIDSLARLVFDYRFNMGSIKNCSFVYRKMNDYANKLRKLYENDHCEFLSLSSVGPAFFVLVKNSNQKKICQKAMEKLGMNIIKTTIYNNTYKCEKYDSLY